MRNNYSKKAKIGAVTLATLCSLALAGCSGIVTNGSGTSPNASGESTTDGFQLADRIKKKIENGEKLTIKLSYHDPSLAFAAPIQTGMKKAGEEFGLDVQMIGPAGGNPTNQVSEIQTLITQGKIDGLAVSSSSNDALKPVIAQAYDAGIPIISFNTSNEGSKQLGFVGQDLKESGKTEAENVLKYLNGKTGKLVVVSVNTGAGWSNDRFEGFKEGIEGSGNEIVGPVNTGNEPSAAYNTIESTMAGQQDAIGIVSLDCCSVTAAGKWVAQKKSGEDFLLAGFDLQSQTVSNVENGLQQFTIGQNPELQGYTAVKVLRDFLMDGTEIKDVDTGADVFTEENIQEAPKE